MLLTNRRHRLLFISLAAMEVAWFLPFALTVFIRMQRQSAPTEVVQLPALLLYSGAWAPLVFFAFCWGILILYLISADLINRARLDFPMREALMLLIVIGTFLFGVRLVIFPDLAFGDLRWLGSVVRAIYDPGTTAPSVTNAAILFLLGVNLFLWLRVATATNRSLTFLSVGMSFRIGLLLAIVGNALLISVARQPVQQGLLYLWIFFGFGLLAVALARIDEKAFLASQSSGTTLPWGRFGQLLLFTSATVSLAVLASRVFTPASVSTVLGWFAPLWQLLTRLFLFLLSAIFIVIGPLLDQFVEAMRALLANMEPIPVGQSEYGALEEAPAALDFGEIVQHVALVRYCMITAALVVVFFLIWLLFVRTRERTLLEEPEISDAEGMAIGGNPFSRLRNLGNLLRNYGLRPGLLAAISVENLYANVSRLAGRRGFPRPAAQPPDEYLQTLMRAFPDYPRELQRLTNAYMRVHYGDHPVDADELAQLRTDYQQMQAPARRPTN